MPVGALAWQGRLSSRRLLYLALLAGGIMGASCQRPDASRLAAAAAQSPATPAARSLRVVSTDALSLWKRTLLSARTAPGVLSVVETHFKHTNSEPEATRFSVVESEVQRRGQIARYRLTYTAPASMKGVVILNDGRSVWRYDARKRLIARRPSVSAPVPPELEEGVAAIPIQSDGAHPEVEAGLELVGSRSAEVLALRTRRSGRIVERRWVDVGTGRTLRLEQYAGRDAHIVRRVEITELHLLRTPRELAWAAGQLTSSFPGDVPVVEAGSSHARHIAEAEDVAGRVRLPLHVRGFALQSAASPAAGLAMPMPTKKLSQFYYRKGTQGISVFVSLRTEKPATLSALQPGSSATTPSVLLQSPGWRPASLGGRRSGFVRESAGGAAIAWAGALGGPYIAVSRMPLSDLLPIVQAFAADRDDAPATALTNLHTENNFR